MNKTLATVIITNYNKKSFIKNTIKSAINQSYKNKEIIIYDDKSTDGSIDIIKQFKNTKLILNKNKKKLSSPLNQLNAIIKALKQTKGNFIFLLDGDDQFKSNKLDKIIKLFQKNEKINMLQDKPFLIKKKKILNLKLKKHIFSIWPSIYPTSCIAIRKKFLFKFLKYSNKKKFPNLEIDARLAMYAYLTNNYNIINHSLTFYNYDNLGISSKYKKFSMKWWKKRFEAFEYLKYLCKRLKIKFKKGPDYYLSALINKISNFN